MDGSKNNTAFWWFGQNPKLTTDAFGRSYKQYTVLLLRMIFPFHLDLPFKLFIQFIMRSYTLIQSLLLASSAWAVEPVAVYNGGYSSAKNIALRIGNGGAGQSGLIEGTPYP